MNQGQSMNQDDLARKYRFCAEYKVDVKDLGRKFELKSCFKILPETTSGYPVQLTTHHTIDEIREMMAKTTDALLMMETLNYEELFYW